MKISFEKERAERFFKWAILYKGALGIFYLLLFSKHGPRATTSFNGVSCLETVYELRLWHSNLCITWRPTPKHKKGT